MTERDNVGSLARDHLANERTFLAWVRTGLGLIGVGVILAKWIEGGDSSMQLSGAVFVGWGLLAMLYAMLRYVQVSDGLDRGKYRTAKRGPLIITLAGIAAAIVAAVLTLL